MTNSLSGFPAFICMPFLYFSVFVIFVRFYMSFIRLWSIYCVPEKWVSIVSFVFITHFCVSSCLFEPSPKSTPDVQVMLLPVHHQSIQSPVCCPLMYFYRYPPHGLHEIPSRIHLQKLHCNSKLSPVRWSLISEVIFDIHSSRNLPERLLETSIICVVICCNHALPYVWSP